MTYMFSKRSVAHGIQNVSRRHVLKGAVATGSLVLAAPLARGAHAAAAPTYATGAGDMPHGVVVDPRVFVSIAPDGTVSIVAHRAEMGTGVRTSLPMIVADELEADWARVHVAQAEGNEANRARRAIISCRCGRLELRRVPCSKTPRRRNGTSRSRR